MRSEEMPTKIINTCRKSRTWLIKTFQPHISFFINWQNMQVKLFVQCFHIFLQLFRFVQFSSVASLLSLQSSSVSHISSIILWIPSIQVVVCLLFLLNGYHVITFLCHQSSLFLCTHLELFDYNIIQKCK